MLTIALALALTGTDVSPAPMPLSPAGRRATAPDLAVGPDGAIHMIWLDQGSQADYKPPTPSAMPAHDSANDLYYQRSSDAGRTWSSPVRVNSKPGEIWGFNTSRPELQVSPKTGTIHIFYPANGKTDDGKVTVTAAYTRSTDGGKTFEPSRALNATSKNDTSAWMHGGFKQASPFGSMGVAPNGDVHAFWIDTRHMESEADNGTVYGATSTDDGKTFSPDHKVTDADVCPCCQVQVAFDSAGALLLSMRRVEGLTRDGAVQVSKDGGKTFTERARLGNNRWSIQACPLKPTVMATGSSGRVYSAWYSGGEKPSGVYFAMSKDGGKTFAAAMAMHPGASSSDAPAIVVSGETVRVFFHARVGEERAVYQRLSSDGGATFSAATRLSGAPANSMYPATVVAKSATLVAYQADGRIFVQAVE